MNSTYYIEETVRRHLRPLAAAGAALLLLLAGCATTGGVPAQPQEEPAAAPEEPVPQEQPAPEAPQPAAEEAPWRHPQSPEDLRGVWQADDGSFYECRGGTESGAFLYYYWPREDVTAAWQAEAARRGMPLHELWERNAEEPVIRYRDAAGNPLPAEEPDGTAHTVLTERGEDGAVYKRDVYALSRAAVMRNLEFFELSPDGTRLREHGTFRTGSSLIDDLEQGDQMYALAR